MVGVVYYVILLTEAIEARARVGLLEVRRNACR